MTTPDAVAEARRLLARPEKAEGGCCAWCRVPLRVRLVPEGAWPDRRRYCGEECRRSAEAARREVKTTTPSPTVVLLALALDGAAVAVTDGRLRVGGRVAEELARSVKRHRRDLADAVMLARLTVAGYVEAGGPRGPWLCCTSCGEGQLLGRPALGRRCRLTPRCGGVLAVPLNLSARGGWEVAPLAG
jgi:hypothetical protein